DGLVPQWLQRIHPRYRTPANTIVLQAVWTIFLVILFSVWDPNAPADPIRPAETVGLEVAAAESGGEAAIVEAVAAEAVVPHSKRIKAAFDVLTDSVICAGLIFYGLAVAAVYVLRRTRPDAHRPYLTWGYPVTPALLLVAYVGAFVSMLIESPGQTLMVLALIAAGAVWYYVAGGHRQASGVR
ncbi:MAG: amino acid permease, partial [Planctomycetaceae bacterium]